MFNPRAMSPRPFGATLTRAVTCAFALGIGFSQVSWAQYYENDFSSGTDTGLKRYNVLEAYGAGATFSFPSGGYRIQGPASPAPSQLGPARAGAFYSEATYTDFTVSMDLVGWDASLGQSMSVVARASDLGLGTSDGYGFLYFPPQTGAPSGSVAINRFSNESATAIAGVALTLDPANDYRLVFTGSGSMLVGQVFDVANPSVALATVTTTDTTYSSGYSGILIVTSNLNPTSAIDATVDNFTTVPEPSVWALGLMGLAGLAAFRRNR